MNRAGLNAIEAALLSFGAQQDLTALKSLIQRLEPQSRTAIAAMLDAVSECPEEELSEVLSTWRQQDEQQQPLQVLSSLDASSARLHQSHLDPRWARVINLALHQDDPLVPELPSMHTLDVCAEVLGKELRLGVARSDLLPEEEQESSSFDLAHFYTWSPDELIRFAERLGYMLYAMSLREQDRRRVARQIHALPQDRRVMVMDMMKSDITMEPLFLKRVDEVLVVLGKRENYTSEQKLTSLGLYTFAVAAGRRLASRALKLSTSLPHPYSLDMHRFVEQHRVSSRRGLEPMAAHAIESMIEHLIQHVDDTHD